MVVRGIPKEFTIDDIKRDLESQALPIVGVHRMRSARNAKEYDMVHVILDKSEAGKKIYGLKTICSLSGFTVETPHKSARPGQCHN